MNWGDVSTWVGIAVSAAFGVTGTWLGWRANRSQARAAGAAEEATRVSREALALARAEAAAREVRWRVERIGRDTCRAANVGTGTAYGVTIQAPHIGLSAPTAVTVHPGASVEFDAIGVWAGPGDVTITYHRSPDLDDEPLVWQSSLP